VESGDRIELRIADQEYGQLELLKQLLGIDSFDISRDDILAHYLKKANSIILGYCNLDILPAIYDDVVVDYAMYLFKNKDSEGLAHKREGERSAVYESGIPQSIRICIASAKN
jgi:hypothetical protein